MTARALLSWASVRRADRASFSVPDMASDELRKITVASRRYAESENRLDLAARDEAIRSAVVDGHPIDVVAESAGVSQEEIVRVVTSS